MCVFLGIGGVLGTITEPALDVIVSEVRNISETIAHSTAWGLKKEALIIDVLDFIKKIPDSSIYCPRETEEDLRKCLADLAPPPPPPSSGVGEATTSDIIVKK